MNMGGVVKFSSLLVFLTILASGCISTPPSQQTPQQEITCNPPYILVGTSCCLDQNSNNICDKDEAPIESTAPTIASQTQTPQTSAPLTLPINDPTEAINWIAQRKDIAEDWNKLVQGTNCGAITNNVGFVAKVDFEKWEIECYRYDFLGMRVHMERLAVKSPQYFDMMGRCDNDLLNDYDRMIRGLSSQLSSVAMAEDLDETCSDCKIVYFGHYFCDRYNEDYKYRFGTAAVDANTGQVYY